MKKVKKVELLKEPVTTGERIRFFRCKLQMTQKELARIVGIKRETLLKIEADERIAKADVLGSVARTLRVSADYLLCLTEVAQPDLNLQKISKITLLTEKALNNLKLLKNNLDKKEIRVINKMLEAQSEKEHSGLLSALGDYLFFDEIRPNDNFLLIDSVTHEQIIAKNGKKLGIHGDELINSLILKIQSRLAKLKEETFKEENTND